MIKVEIQEEPNTVRVVYNGETHTGTWNDKEEIADLQGNENILRAALLAWEGEEGEWEIEPEELTNRSQGWWSVP